MTWSLVLTNNLGPKTIRNKVLGKEIAGYNLNNAMSLVPWLEREVGDIRCQLAW
jgi:hypothetical protein